MESREESRDRKHPPQILNGIRGQSRFNPGESRLAGRVGLTDQPVAAGDPWEVATFSVICGGKTHGRLRSDGLWSEDEDVVHTAAGRFYPGKSAPESSDPLALRCVSPRSDAILMPATRLSSIAVRTPATPESVTDIDNVVDAGPEVGFAGRREAGAGGAWRSPLSGRQDS